jgi:hypothetical protein
MNKSNDGLVTYRAGQNFPEFPGHRHTVLMRMRARPNPPTLLAVFVVDTDEKEQLLTPLKK